MRTVLAALALWTSAPAYAEEAGIPVKVVVLDAEGHPIAKAVVRHPDGEVRHDVNAADGSWEGTKLYAKDGAEIAFVKGAEVPLTVSAPGYKSLDVLYVVKKKKNVLKLELEPLPSTELDISSNPTIGFDHDDPIDGR